MVLTRSMVTTNNVQRDEPQPTALERQVQTLTAAMERLSKQNEVPKEQLRQKNAAMVSKRRIKKVPVLNEETKRGRKEVMPQADQKDRT